MVKKIKISNKGFVKISSAGVKPVTLFFNSRLHGLQCHCVLNDISMMIT